MYTNNNETSNSIQKLRTDLTSAFCCVTNQAIHILVANCCCSQSQCILVMLSGSFCREEEDREVAAAMRASMAQRRQEERGAMQERSAPKHCREERTTERTEPEEPRHRTGHIKPISKPPGEKGKH